MQPKLPLWLFSTLAVAAMSLLGTSFTGAETFGGEIGVEGSTLTTGAEILGRAIDAEASSMTAGAEAPGSTIDAEGSTAPGPIIPTGPRSYPILAPSPLREPKAEASFEWEAPSDFAPTSAPLFVSSRCDTPMSLMLHSSFGAERMWHLSREIVRRGIKTTTYRQAAADLEQGKCPAPDSLIVSLDDFGTDYLRSDFQSMIRMFAERNLVMVIAAVVHGPQDPAAWEYLRQLEAHGFEVASHSIDHPNLARLEQHEIEEQLIGSYDVICEKLGRCPKTLILPFGLIDSSGWVRGAASDYDFIVGIAGGRTFSGEAPLYLGRIGPDNVDQRATMQLLETSFESDEPSRFSLLPLRGLRCSAGPAAPHGYCRRLASPMFPTAALAVLH